MNNLYNGTRKFKEQKKALVAFEKSHLEEIDLTAESIKMNRSDFIRDASAFYMAHIKEEQAKASTVVEGNIKAMLPAFRVQHANITH